MYYMTNTHTHTHTYALQCIAQYDITNWTRLTIEAFKKQYSFNNIKYYVALVYIIYVYLLFKVDDVKLPSYIIILSFILILEATSSSSSFLKKKKIYLCYI